MKILVVSPTFGGIGGIARHTQGLTDFLKKEGQQVDIISSDNTLTIPIKKLKNPSFMISAYIKGAFKKGYDIVHAQGPPAAFAMKNVSGKKVLSLHGIHHEQVKLLHGNMAGGLAKKYEDYALKWADAITVSSKEMLDYYTQKGYNVYFTPNAIDIDSLPSGIDRRYDKQVVYAARLSEEKGILQVLEMAEKLPKDVNLIILGDGPERTKVETLCSKQKNIHFLGPQKKHETISIIRGSDMLIQPSIMEGGVSYTLLESMACKTPIICTNVGGGKDILSHMTNAYLVEPNNPTQLLNSVIELFSNDKKREELTKSAYSSVCQLDWKVIGKKYLEIYINVLK